MASARSGDPVAAPSRSIDRRLTLLGVAAVALLGTAAYLPVRSGGFIQDDHTIVETNPVVRQGGLGLIFGTDYWGGSGGGGSNLFRPITILSFALERGAGGAVDPAGAHRVNILLHAATALALLWLALRVGASRPVAVGAAALFAAHPVHVAAVAGLVGRAEILAALFTLLALVTQTASGDPPARDAARGRRRLLRRAAPWGTAGLVFLALGSKETAIAAPFLLLWLELLLRPPASGRFRSWLLDRGAALLPSAIAVAAFAALRARALGSVAATAKVLLADNPLVSLRGVERAATALGLAARAAGQIVLPVHLSPDYSGNVIAAETSLLAPLPIGGLLVLLAEIAVVAAPWLPPRRAASAVGNGGARRRLSLAAALFLLPYLVTGNLLVLIGVAYAERLLYLPSVGFCFLAPLALERAVRSIGHRTPREGEPLARALGIASGSLLAVAVLLLAGTTWRGSDHWRSNETMWEYAVRAEPKSPRAQFTLGMIRREQGRDDEALSLFRRAVELWPHYSAAWFEAGMILARKGDLPGAEDALRQACARNPSNEAAWLNLGTVLRRERRLPDAAAALREASTRFPDSVDLAAELAEVLFEARLFPEAAEVYRRLVRGGRDDLRPRLAEAESRSAR